MPHSCSLNEQQNISQASCSLVIFKIVALSPAAPASGVDIRAVPHIRSLSLKSIGEGNVESSSYRYDALTLCPKVFGRDARAEGMPYPMQNVTDLFDASLSPTTMAAGYPAWSKFNLCSCWTPMLSPLHENSRIPRRRPAAPRYLRRRIGVGGCGTRPVHQ